MVDESLLPDELQSGGGKAARSFSESEKAEKLAALSTIVVTKRDEAIKARKDSGIEEVWLACEEAYLGMDEANRSDFEKAKWAKPTSIQGPVTVNVPKTENKSTAFVRLTTRYVDMGAAKLSEIVLPIDDKAFSFSPSPVPDVVMGQAAPNPATAQPAQPTAVSAAITGQPAPDEESGAAQKAKKAETRIYDWMVESRYPLQMRKVINDSARIGVGVLKGPFPDQRTRKAYSVSNGRGQLEILTKVSPAMKWVDPWNLYPAAGCGEDIHAGDVIFERDFLTPASLRKLKELRAPSVDGRPGAPIYIGSAIDRVLAEGPNKCNAEGANPNDKVDKSRFTIWHMTGTLEREDMQALGAPGAEDLPEDLVNVFAVVTMANDTVIRVAFNPLEKSGSFPYRTFPWSRRAGHWAGVGVGEQVSMPQRMANAGLRSWMNNAGKSSGVQIVRDRRNIVPADGNEDVTPDKLWDYVGDGLTDDIRKVFSVYEIPDRGESLLRILEKAFQIAEEQSNIPLVSQGQTGPNDPQTFGQAELLNDNSKTLLRDKAYTLDDCVTEPLVHDLYEWLLLDDTVPDDEKGDFEIDARGSIGMVEKAIQEQTFPLLIQAAAQNPSYGQNPAKLFAEWMRAKRFNPDLTKYTPQEQQQALAAAQVETPQEKVAKIRAGVDLHRQEMSDNTRKEIAAQDLDRDTAYNESLAHRDEIQANARREELLLRERIAMMEMANKRDMSFEQIKAELAGLSLKLTTQKELSREAMAVDVHKHHSPAPAVTPPTEPTGRAQPGQSYAQ